MKFTKSLVTIILCALMVLGISSFVVVAEGNGSNLTCVLEKNEVNVGETVKLTIGNKDMKISSIYFGVYFDKDLLTVTKRTGSPTLEYLRWDEDDEIYVKKELDYSVLATVDEANTKGLVSLGFSNANVIEVNAKERIIQITFVAKKAGTVNFVFYEDSAGDDECNTENAISGVSLTIKAPCTHENKTTNYNKIDNADKHTVSVTCDDCGEPVGEATEEACDTNGAKCVEWSCDKCKAVFAANAEHNYNNPEHKCACGNVEMFTLTIKDWHSEDVLIDTLVIPFGGNLFEYLDDVVVENIADDYGIYKFSGVWFDDYKSLDENSTMPGDDITVYAIFSYTGWTHYKDGWKYDVDDVPLMTGWTEIDGEWYYLDTETGVRAEGKTRVPYPTEKVDGNTYAPNQEDIDYSASKDRVFVDKVEAWFLFGEDGKFQSEKTGIINGIYALNGMIAWHPGVVESNGEYYYFIGDLENGGNKLAEGDTWITRNNTDADFVIGGCYNFKDGKLSGIEGVVNGKYYENSKLMLGKGLVKLEGGYIYVRSTGEVVTNREYWITKTNGYSIVNGVYEFDENGYMVDPIDPTVYDGIVEVDGVKYYYENGIKQCCKGVVEMTDENGDIYYIYVKSDGSLATGTYWPTNTNNYLKRVAYDWGTDGRYYPGN